VRADGLQTAYSDAENPEIRIGVHQLLRLAFIPVEDVGATFDLLMDDLPDRLVDFADIFEKTYVRGRPARGRRPGTRARYEPKSWNQYLTAQNGDPRTNNQCEAWRRRFNTIVGKSYPSFYAFLRELQKEQPSTETLMEELELGSQYATRRRENTRSLPNGYKESLSGMGTNKMRTYSGTSARASHSSLCKYRK